MKVTILLVLSIIILQACKAQKNMPVKPSVLKGVCNEDYYYELDSKRVYLDKSYDSLLGSVFISNEGNSLKTILDFCNKPCNMEKETRLFLSKSHCNFMGDFATIDLVEENSDSASLVVKNYIVRFFCCGSSGRRYPVYLLSMMKGKNGKQEVLKFEYSYDEL